MSVTYHSDGHVDPYLGLITLQDVLESVRGWDNVLGAMQVSRYTAKQLLPPSVAAAAIIPSASHTLSRQQSETVQTLPSDVVLRIRCNSIFLAALKFASTFIDTIPFAIEQNALVCLLRRVTPNLVMQVTVQYTDIQGIPSPQLVPGIEYAVPRITQTEVAKSVVLIDFTTDRRVRRSGAAAMILSDGTVTGSAASRGDAKELVKRIEASGVLAKAWVMASSFMSVFPSKKPKSEQDRTVEVSESGIEISGSIEGKKVVLRLGYDESVVGSQEYGYQVAPHGRLYGRMLMDGLSHLGRCTSASTHSTITLTIYDKVSNFFYLGITVAFSQLSAGTVYMPIVPASKASLPAAMPAAMPSSAGDFPPQANPYAPSLHTSAASAASAPSTASASSASSAASASSASADLTAIDFGGDDFLELLPADAAQTHSLDGAVSEAEDDDGDGDEDEEDGVDYAE